MQNPSKITKIHSQGILAMLIFVKLFSEILTIKSGVGGQNLIVNLAPPEPSNVIKSLKTDQKATLGVGAARNPK